jgi:serine/threonine protein kinase
MNAETWQKIKIILEEVLEMPQTSRARFLEKSCAGDEDLQREIELLLKFDDTKNSDALEQNAFSAITGNAFDETKEIFGERIGNYKIIGELGAGGMGAVFLAERTDGAFEQKVALKLIKRGMDSEAILRRFVNERQILASLEHPNIAHLVDGGTTENGLPYFVLEYVEGETIIDYADRENLNLEERLTLFRQVCVAVSFAHSNLVIHRDLKPSNILVTKDGKVKLLDFGIAKVLKSDTDDATTATQMHVFTPEYASPEQVRGEKLTTATDVYSLGVNLYELLTGSRPYETDSKNIGEIIKAVCETEPVRPSAWRDTETRRRGDTEKNRSLTASPRRFIPASQLKGDLDNIILKALRKEPERRYSSVEQFSEDIRRQLEGLPVTASKDTWNYRASKFIQRNRISVAAAALIFLSLIGGLATTLWQNRIARQERERAERRSENLRKISNSMVSEIERAIRDLPGSMPARKLLLDRAVEQLDALAAESDRDNKLKLELAWTYQNLSSLPDRKLSDRNTILEKAAKLTEEVIQAEPKNLAARDRLAMIYLDMIFNSRLRGDVDFTLDYNRRSVRIVDEILRESPDTIEYQDSFWTANYHYALTTQQLGRADETIETAQKILPVAEKMYQTNADGYDYMKPHLTRTAIGFGLSYKGDYQAAVKEFETALNECLAEAAKRSENNILKRNEANIRLQLGSALELSGNAEAALNEGKLALAIREKMATQNPLDLDFKIAVADAELFYGQMLGRQNQIATVEERFRKALDIYQKVAETDVDRLQVKILMARAQTALGNVVAQKGNLTEGLNYLRDAAKFYESIGAAITIDAGLKRHYAETLAFLASATMKDKNSAEAVKLYRRSLDLWQDLKQQGTLKNSDSSQIEEIQAEIAENGKAL